MSYTPRDTGEFVRAAGKGDTERNHGARKKYETVDWRSHGDVEGFEQVSPKRIKKVYKLK